MLDTIPQVSLSRFFSLCLATVALWKRLSLTLGSIAAVWLIVFVIAGSGAATVATIAIIIWGIIGLYITR